MSAFNAEKTAFGTEETAFKADERATSQVSPRLYNRDLAPLKRAGRQWGAYNIFTLWANDVHSLGNYGFAIGLFAVGLGAWQVLLTFLLGSVLIFLLLTLSAFMGEKTGVPFPVLSRIVFGINGAQIAAIVRGGVAIVWFGIQTYLAASVLNVLLVALIPPLGPLLDVSVLGLSALGWISFIFLWILQVIIVSYGMGMIRRYLSYVGPVILITMLSIAIWVFIKAGGSIALSIDDELTGGAMWLQIFEGAALWVVIYGTFVLNVCDFTRSAKSKRSIVVGNLIGIPVNMLFFALIVVGLAGAQFKIDGTIITGPADIVQTIPNTFFLVVASLALILLTVAVNLLGNFVAPIYMLANLFPRSLNFRRAGLVTATIGLVILPWNLYDSPVVIQYFLGGLGAALGPVFGVIIADYWILRRTQINVPALYADDATGDYYYESGFNRRAIIALVPAAVIAILLALVPVFEVVSGFSWFIGAGIAFGLYLLVADRSRPFRQVDGDHLAVASD